MKKFLTILGLGLFVVSFSWAQRTISGTVTDSDGEPLIGATVLVKGTPIGTATDVDGTYSVEVPADNNTLIISYTGFATYEVELGASNLADVQLSSSDLFLDEVIVVAYGAQKKREITGAVTSLKSEDLENVQAAHIVQGIQGKVPGVQIINQSGQPGSAPSVRFRGIGSVNASSAPLYVVDGVPFNGNINSIASQDIESINFLKDASANALYGSRGANGVIIISTKKGKKEGLEVNVETRFGVNDRASSDYDVITDPGDYYRAWYDRWRIGLIDMGTAPADAATQAAAQLISGGEFSLGYNNYNVADDQVIDPNTGQLNPNASLLYQDNWEDQLFDASTRSELYLSLKSNAGNIGTFFSVGYLDDQGYALNSGFERITARGALDFAVNDNIDVGGSVNYANTVQDAPIQNVGSSTYSNLFSWARNVGPIYPVFARDANGALMTNPDGSSLYDFGEADDGVPGVRPYGAFNNPVATSLLDFDENNLDNLSGRVYATVRFLKNFKFTYNFSTDLVNGSFSQLATPIGGDAKNANGRITSTNTKAVTLAHQQLLSWTKDLGDHSLGILMGHESNEYKFDLLRGQKTEALISSLPRLSNGANIQFLDGYGKDYNVEGFFSRINYDYKEKIFINASFRRDGSSVFHPDNRWGNFYGFGIAYDLAQESFLDGANWLSGLRVKASYGQQGNDAILYEDVARTVVGDSDNRNYYAYVDQFDVVNAGGGVAGVSFVTLGNPDLKWETSTNINAGLELGLINNRIRLSAEYFIRDVEDMLFFKPLPISEGRGAFSENIGDMENKGIELAVDADLIQTNDFNWSIHWNGTHYNNEITSLPQEFIDDVNISFFRFEEGRSRYDYFMRQFAGVDAMTGAATWWMDELDMNGDPTGERVATDDYNAATEYFLGKSAIPDIYGGFSTSVGYKGFDLSVGFSYQFGGYGYDGVYQSLLQSAGDVGNNFHKDVFNSWTPENTTATIPRLDVFDTDQDNTSDYYLVDASYVNLNDITLSYTLKKSVLSHIGVDRAKIYATAQNVKLWTDRDGYDPRLTVSGRTLNEYSVIRSISMGLQVTF